MKNTKREHNVDVTLWKTLNCTGKPSELCSSKIFRSFAGEFIVSFEDRVAQALDLHDGLLAMIEFGCDYQNFVESYAEYVQLALEIEAGLPIFNKFAKTLHDKNLNASEKKSEAYPCIKDIHKTWVHGINSSSLEILDSHP